MKLFSSIIFMILLGLTGCLPSGGGSGGGGALDAGGGPTFSAGGGVTDGAAAQEPPDQVSDKPLAGGVPAPDVDRTGGVKFFVEGQATACRLMPSEVLLTLTGNGRETTVHEGVSSTGDFGTGKHLKIVYKYASEDDPVDVKLQSKMEGGVQREGYFNTSLNIPSQRYPVSQGDIDFYLILFPLPVSPPQNPEASPPTEALIDFSLLPQTLGDLNPCSPVLDSKKMPVLGM